MQIMCRSAFIQSDIDHYGGFGTGLGTGEAKLGHQKMHHLWLRNAVSDYLSIVVLAKMAMDLKRQTAIVNGDSSLVLVAKLSIQIGYCNRAEIYITKQVTTAAREVYLANLDTKAFQLMPIIDGLFKST